MREGPAPTIRSLRMIGATCTVGVQLTRPANICRPGHATMGYSAQTRLIDRQAAPGLRRRGLADATRGYPLPPPCVRLTPRVPLGPVHDQQHDTVTGPRARRFPPAPHRCDAVPTRVPVMSRPKESFDVVPAARAG